MQLPMDNFEAFRQSRRLQRFRRFGIELILLLGFLWVVLQLNDYFHFSFVGLLFPGFEGRLPYSARLTILLAFTFFFAIVFYGTSFEVTPLSFAMALFRPFIMFTRRSRIPAKALSRDEERQLETSSHEQPVEVITKVKTVESPVPKDQKAGMLIHDAPDHLLAVESTQAEKLARRMERRTNTYLIVGVAMGMLGLGFWWMSLPRKELLTIIDLVQQGLPRITVLLFIEVLAGFFLRQYRLGVEDFKYFLELKRRADANRASYAILKELGSADAMRSFADRIFDSGAPKVTLQSGETTPVLEAMKAEQNVTLNALKIMTDNVQEMLKNFAKGK